jgi:hypothetical protein
MAKYVLVYTGGKMADTPAEQEAAMAAWGTFLGGLGEALVDAGNPFGPSAKVGGNGGGPSGLSGYTIINAASLDEASEKAQDAPVIANGGAVEVYETIEVM